MRGRALLLGLLAWFPACTLLTPTDGLSGGPAANEVVSGSPAAARTDASVEVPPIGGGDGGLLDASVDASDAGTFVEDFDAPALGSAWTWQDPMNDATYSLTQLPGSLVVSIPPGAAHDCWGTKVTCARVLRPFSNDPQRTFIVTVSNTLSASVQTYGLMLWGDEANFLRFELRFASQGTSVAVYMQNGGTPSNGPKTASVPLGTSNKMRVVRNGTTFDFSYSTDAGATWTTVPGSPLVMPMALKMVGVHVISAMSNPGVTAIFDSLSVQ